MISTVMLINVVAPMGKHPAYRLSVGLHKREDQLPGSQIYLTPRIMKKEQKRKMLRKKKIKLRTIMGCSMPKGDAKRADWIFSQIEIEWKIKINK